jgi:GNAT superfamily N-acetyltransferase
MDRAAFCCGNDELDDFFTHHAARHHAAHRVRVTVAMHGGRIVGFYWLVAHGQPLGRISSEAEAAFDTTKFDATPLVYLGMIGTDRSVQGLGIGKILMVHAMRQTLAVADVVGVYALTLDAVDAETARRYAKWGFEYCVEGADTTYVPMYIPVETIRRVPGI